MIKRIITILLIIAVTGSLIVPVNAAGDITQAAELRNGFSLAASDFDPTGIATDSSFFLSSQNDITLEKVKTSFTIEGEPVPTIETVEKNKFKVMLARPLLENKVYTFRLKSNNEITWSFQTRASFQILGTVPGDKSNEVPVNSGIEINFSHDGYEDINQYFQITPAVEGRFEKHKKTVVFIPKALKEGTIYTVTVKKGLKIKDTGRSLENDYVFSFETSKSDSRLTETTKGFISYNKSLFDYATNSAPNVPVNYYINKNVYKDASFKVKTAIYTYKDFNTFYEALVKKTDIPQWATINYTDNYIAVDSLEKVLEFEQNFESDNGFKEGSYLKVPNSLPRGYYVLDSYWDDFRFQTFLQVTDTGIYLTKSTTKTMVWLNDIISQKPIEGATVSFSGINNTYTSDASGVAYFDTPVQLVNQDESPYKVQFLKIDTKDGNASVLDCNYFYSEAQDSYWKYFYTDRNMYKPDDTIEVWGFIKNRYKEENIKNLTLELNKGYYLNMPLVKQMVDVNNGFFETKMKIPTVEAGGYNLVLKNGSTIVYSSYIAIENYTKPTYQFEITKDKEAVFQGQEVKFNVKASFFEGTGVSNLKTDYFINGYPIGDSNIAAKGTTDLQGNMIIKYTPKAAADVQGEQYVGMNVRALLPESGEISESNSIRVFVNDINVNLKGEIKNNIGTIDAQVNKIVLDRLNNGTAKDSSDYLGDAVSGKVLTGTVYKNTWVQKEDGDYYDFINKVTQKKYKYELEKTLVKNVYMTTASEGKASIQFDAPKLADTYYTAEFKCADNTGKQMKYEIYVGEYFDYIKYSNNDYYSFSGGKDAYNFGDPVELTMKKGKEDLPEGHYLFIKMQNGIREYTISNKPVYTSKFSDNDVPNVVITGIYFNGKTYKEADSCNVVLNQKVKNLTIDAAVDKRSYRPGDDVTIKVNVKDKNGIPVKSVVNASIVDEAFFKLSDQGVDTLSALYNQVGAGILLKRKSHEYSADDIIYGSRNGLGISSLEGSKALLPTSKADTAEAPSASAIREVFKDTAYFTAVETDDSGVGEIKFKLPDNVTSWRVTLSGISQDLFAGNEKVSLNVTLPFFVNYSLNTTYMEGDKAVIGVNAYGNSLTEDELVMFEVSSSQNPDQKVSVVGKAFERINIPLWNLKEGLDDIIIKATTNNGLSDSVKQPIEVVKSYYQIDKAVYNKLVPGMAFTGGKTVNTDILFQDKSMGMFLSQLIGMYYSDGYRVDQKVTSNLAAGLIGKYFKDYQGVKEPGALPLSYYQKEDGGLSLLPYTKSDLEISAKLAALVEGKVEESKLKNYFYDILDGKTSGSNILALYGLASIREPVLIDLDQASKIDNLSLKDNIYLALSYAILNETAKAAAIYDSKISKYVEEYKPYFRVNTGNDKDDVLELTSTCAVLASKLNKTEKLGLYEYIGMNNAKDVLLSVEKLQFILQEIDQFSTTKAKFSYSYNGEEKTIPLDAGNSYKVTIPSANLTSFKVTGVEGDISAVTIFKEKVVDIGKVDKDIAVKRSYYYMDGKPMISNTLKQGDIIKVKITWDISSKAFDGEYEVTDYLPSGLKPVENYFNISQYYRFMDDQRVKFYIYNNPYWNNNSDRSFEYYARVVSPGTYMAQGTVIQGLASKENINVAKSDTITIESTGEISTPIDPNGVKVQVDGKPIIFDAQPVIRDGRTLVPLRAIFEALGAEVKWDAKTKTVTGTKEGNKISLTINSKVASVNGTQKTLDVPAGLMNNRTFVPTRFISESLGADVDWNEGKKTVLITSSN